MKWHLNPSVPYKMYDIGIRNKAPPAGTEGTIMAGKKTKLLDELDIDLRIITTMNGPSDYESELVWVAVPRQSKWEGFPSDALVIKTTSTHYGGRAEKSMMRAGVAPFETVVSICNAYRRKVKASYFESGGLRNEAETQLREEIDKILGDNLPIPESGIAMDDSDGKFAFAACGTLALRTVTEENLARAWLSITEES